MEREQEQNIINGLFSIRPKAEFTIGGNFDYASLTWLDKNQVKPTEKEFNDALTAWNTECDAQEYARNRRTEYDALNQHEMLYDDEVNGTTTWKDAIAAIKTKYPKG